MVITLPQAAVVEAFHIATPKNRVAEVEALEEAVAAPMALPMPVTEVLVPSAAAAVVEPLERQILDSPLEPEEMAGRMAAVAVAVPTDLRQ